MMDVYQPRGNAWGDVSLLIGADSWFVDRCTHSGAVRVYTSHPPSHLILTVQQVMGPCCAVVEEDPLGNTHRCTHGIWRFSYTR